MQRLTIAVALYSTCATGMAQNPGDVRPAYGGDAGGKRYSRRAQITPKNVVQLVPAWEYHTDDVSDGTGTISATSFQATPILFDDKLVFCTPYNRIVSVDPWLLPVDWFSSVRPWRQTPSSGRRSCQPSPWRHQ